MPLPITDRKLSQLYKSYENQFKADPSVTLGDAQVLEILALVGDKSGLSAAKLLEQLSAPGLTRAEQVALVKAGMTASEKKDLGHILDSGTVPLEPSAKNFIEAVLDRAPVDPNTGALVITGDQKNGLAGMAKPGARIEAINISTAPGGRLHMDDTMVVATADASGKFSGGVLPDLQEGDLIRVRARHADGSVGDWQVIEASGLASEDTRNAVVALFRIGVTDAGNGKIGVTNINASRQVSEPGAVLQFTNRRTGEKTQVTITDVGGFPAGFTLNGKAGDTFTVAASDRKNNLGFTQSVGTVTVPGGDGGTVDLIPDPELHKEERYEDGRPKFSKKTFTGPLFKDGVHPSDVAQGQIGNCYFPSALGAVAFHAPEVIQNMIRENGDGTYTVVFKERDWATSKYRDVEIKVDGDLYVRPFGGPLYGSTSDPDRSTGGMELWYPLVEKAYAMWKGSYDAIGNGGSASAVIEAVTGRPVGYYTVRESDLNGVWDTIRRAVDAKQPIAAGTYSETEGARYTNTGVYGNHSYSVLGYEEENGERYVKLRNPWGESEPHGNGPNDGYFRLKLQDFTRLYQGLGFSRA